jgi:hypothetical protein
VAVPGSTVRFTDDISSGVKNALAWTGLGAPRISRPGILWAMGIIRRVYILFRGVGLVTSDGFVACSLMEWDTCLS